MNITDIDIDKEIDKINTEYDVYQNQIAWSWWAHLNIASKKWSIYNALNNEEYVIENILHGGEKYHTEEDNNIGTSGHLIVVDNYMQKIGWIVDSHDKKSIVFNGFVDNYKFIFSEYADNIMSVIHRGICI